jgi:hypothetical protein
MIRFWIRELLGWFLVGVGLFIFYICFAILLIPETKFFEASILSVIGIIVFRGGIHLLKVAVAARVAMQFAEPPRPTAAADQPKQKTTTPWDW